MAKTKGAVPAPSAVVLVLIRHACISPVARPLTPSAPAQPPARTPTAANPAASPPSRPAPHVSVPDVHRHDAEPAQQRPTRSTHTYRHQAGTCAPSPMVRSANVPIPQPSHQRVPLANRDQHPQRPPLHRPPRQSNPAARHSGCPHTPHPKPQHDEASPKHSQTPWPAAATPPPSAPDIPQSTSASPTRYDEMLR